MRSTKIKVNKINEKISENFTKIKISGIAKIIYGDNAIVCKNKFTRYLMSSIVSMITFERSGYLKLARTVGLSRGATARIGTDTSTYTSPDMSDLVSKVNTAPNSITRRLIKEPDYTLYIAEFIFTWNTGTLPDIYEGATGEDEIDGKVGEFGVYLRVDNDDWTTGLLNPNRYTYYDFYSPVASLGMTPVGGAGVRLASRIASRDGAFDPFEFYGSIDPLTFKWRFQVAIV